MSACMGTARRHTWSTTTPARWRRAGAELFLCGCALLATSPVGARAQDGPRATEPVEVQATSEQTPQVPTDPNPAQPATTEQQESAPSAARPAEPAPEASPQPEPEPARAYTFGVGLDLYTRFLWRGVSFGEQWTLQPTASFAAYGLSVDLWASAAPDQSSLVDYVGITLGYTYEASFGTFAVTLADWIFTQRYTAEGTVETGAPYLFDFDGNGNGSHWLDLTLAYTGPSAFPLTVEFGVVVYNDPDHSLYAGLRYDIDVGAGFTLTPEFGVVFGRSARWYLTDADPINVTNCALTLSRTVALGHGITLPLSIALVVNPESERVHIVAGVGVHL